MQWLVHIPFFILTSQPYQNRFLDYKAFFELWLCQNRSPYSFFDPHIQLYESLE